MPIIFKLAANVLLELVVNCGKEEFYANFYSYIRSHTIRIILTPTANYIYVLE